MKLRFQENWFWKFIRYAYARARDWTTTWLSYHCIIFVRVFVKFLYVNLVLTALYN